MYHGDIPKKSICTFWDTSKNSEEGVCRPQEGICYPRAKDESRESNNRGDCLLYGAMILQTLINWYQHLTFHSELFEDCGFT